jgi:hypothetical protein
MKIKKTEKPRRLTLRGWAAMDDLRRRIDKRAEEGQWQSIPDLIFDTIELIYGKADRKCFWLDAADLYGRGNEANQPTMKFPILTSKDKQKPLPWEYDGRTWYFWLNTFAEHYGWDDERVGNMDIDTAIGLYQEIQIEEQMKNEFVYGLSEVAYVYDKGTKKSRFSPLPRPQWMLGVAPTRNAPVKTSKMPAIAIPMGEVIYLDEKDKNAGKKTESV